MIPATPGLRRVEISAGILNRLLLHHPLMTAKVGLAIYWQALRLFSKRVPIFKHISIANSTTTGEKLTP